jgi:uncharacterized small protein (DUF1192 family)
MNEIKSLVVGSLRHDHVTSVAWTKLSTVNVLDFDIVVLFLPSLDNDTIRSIGTETLFKLQHVFAQFLKSNGAIFVLGAPPLDNENHSQWLWCPIPLVSLGQRGDTVEIRSGEFKNLLNLLKSWDCVYQVHPQNPAQVLSMVMSQGMAPLQFEYEPYAQNRAGGVLAGKFTYFTEMRGGQRHEWPGSVTVLPHFPGEESRSVVATALVDILGKPQLEGSPEWLASISMPSVIPIDGQIALLRQEIAELESKVKHQLAEKAKAERYKRLLYVSSFELEDLIAECLALLGATIKPARYSQEEFVMEWNGSVFLAECKGVAKSISLGHLRQVQDYVLKYEEEEGAAGKGILFGNAWRDLPPTERDTKDKPIFPQNVIERAQQFGVSLVSSVDLFYAISGFLNGEIAAEGILTVITSASGVADFGSLKGR